MEVKMKNRRKKGSICISVGLVLIIAAFVLAGYNLWDEARAGKESLEIVEDLIEEIPKSQEKMTDRALYEEYPEMEMPTVLIDGDRYVGVLEIPVLDMELPIMESWSYANLKKAPCRYDGSVYSKDMVIAGHNYRSHFGALKKLTQRDEVFFIDVDGNEFIYEVAEVEVLAGTAVEEMKSGEWDLTLFTCTYDGRSRTTVRLIMKD